ncbi:uncharacterized protein LOC114865036 [Betta splendens]|uniref:non-specific serine/threonine protein kinase n=1 Tax=Betta splendens TaxID=158456 RepID=A0A6P7NV40_BETSP|nr:uncharacterized protein LOC114865036 [Betta splendens]
MGSEQSILENKGYVLEKTENKNDPDMPFAATKGDEKFLIKMFTSNPASEITIQGELDSERKLLNISHPHIVSSKIEISGYYYVVTDYCEGGSLADKIKERNEPPQESEVLSWIVEICMALKTIHQKGFLQKDLTPEDIHFTTFGKLCLGGYQKVYENLKNTTSKKSSTETGYMAPEVYLKGTFDVKSDIWSVGCILYELCTLQPAFSAESTIMLTSKIHQGPYPTLPEHFSEDLCDLLNDIFNQDPVSRPTTSEIMECPLIINCLINKIKKTLNEVQTKVDALRALADGLERVHQGTTIGSLAGGVIGAAGGITSIVGLFLAPFTLGASLIVTGVGVGVGAVGSVTAGVSNITNMVNQSTDRKAVRNVIKEIEEKTHAVITWLQELNNSLQKARSRCETLECGHSKKEYLAKSGIRGLKCLGGVAELVRLVKVMNVGKIAAQGSRVVLVAQVTTGVLSALFVAADIFFIAMDAKEIHHIRQAKAANEGTNSEAESEAATNVDMSTSDEVELLPGVPKHNRSQSQDQSPSENTQVNSEVMKFVLCVRKAADDLQKVLDELKSMIESITSPEDDSNLDCHNRNAV